MRSAHRLVQGNMLCNMECLETRIVDRGSYTFGNLPCCVRKALWVAPMSSLHKRQWLCSDTSSRSETDRASSLGVRSCLPVACICMSVCSNPLLSCKQLMTNQGKKHEFLLRNCRPASFRHPCAATELMSATADILPPLTSAIAFRSAS